MKNEKISDSWQTPADLFNVLDKGGEYMGMKFEGFHFDVDLCAEYDNTKCLIYGTDYLNDRYIIQSGSKEKYPAFMPSIISSRTCFMNPPYSDPKPFIEKAWEDSKHCKIVCLVKCDLSTRWWATFWEYHRQCDWCDGYGYQVCDGGGELYCPNCRGTGKLNQGKEGCEVIFFPKRIKFDPPQELIDSGEVWKVGDKWVQKCKNCEGRCYIRVYDYLCTPDDVECTVCTGKGYKTLSGPSFSCALLIFDRRGVE